MAKCVSALALAMAVALTSIPARGGDPTALNPLLAPLFSTDPQSPEVLGGLVTAGDLLNPDGATPVIMVPAGDLGLVQQDDVDALAGGELPLAYDRTFVLIFSVDRGSVGSVPPDPNLFALGFEFNAFDQAQKNQEAGDAFMSLLLFTRLGPVPPTSALRSSLAENNTLVINHGDAGGVDFSLTPSALSPEDFLPPDAPLGAVDGGTGTFPSLWSQPGVQVGRVLPGQLLFSLSRSSPSALGNGARITLDPDPNSPGTESTYLDAAEIGLTPNDEIDGLIVFEDGDYQFEAGFDQVLFSLAPGSPSLGIFGPADIFSTSGGGLFHLFCPAQWLGLLPTDNVTMIDFVPCDDVLTCVNDWAIGTNLRNCPSDLNGSGSTDLEDLSILLANFGSSDATPEQGDLNGDAQVDLADLSMLLTHFGQTCPALPVR